MFEFYIRYDLAEFAEVLSTYYAGECVALYETTPTLPEECGHSIRVQLYNWSLVNTKHHARGVWFYLRIFDLDNLVSIDWARLSGLYAPKVLVADVYTPVNISDLLDKIDKAKQTKLIPPIERIS